MVEKANLSTLKEGDVVDALFVVKIKKGISKYSKGFNFKLLLSDDTGRSIEHIFWGSEDEKVVRALYDSIPADGVVRVQGKVGSFQGKPQLTTNEPMVIQWVQAEKGMFIAPARKDIDVMFAELRAYVNMMEDEKVRAFIAGLFEDAQFTDAYVKHPAAITTHHNWVGGLLQHVLEMLEYAKATWEAHPELDKDLLIAGCILHDVGKLWEMEMDTRIKSTTEGQLIGHITQGVLFVSKKLEKSGIDALKRTKLIHLMLSHHGHHEFGSPKEPMFPEAIALYFCDELSAKVTEALEFRRVSREETEDEFMYHRRDRKNVFLR